jgi:hypothetical protein
MSYSHYFKGQTVRSTVHFRDSSNDAVDPAAVSCKIKDPVNGETEYIYGTDAELTKTDTGVYTLSIDTSDYSGEYRGQWLGADTDNSAVVDFIFWVWSLYDGEKQYGGR